MLKVTRAKYIEGFRIELGFNDGTDGFVDLEGRLEGPIFQPLKNLETFRRFELTDHTLQWLNGAGFAPEYLRGLAVEQLETSQAADRRERPGAVHE